MKDWFSDRECDLKDTGEILSAVRQIAVLHKLFEKGGAQGGVEHEVHGVPAFLWPWKSITGSLRRPGLYPGKTAENEFELCVIASFEPFLPAGRSGGGGDEKAVSRDEKGWTERYSICHGELNQHHILMGRDYVAVTGFGRMHLGLQVEDLYYFMRKVMEKHNWDCGLGKWDAGGI